jgi:1,4-alpha-glucan branching enzyme
VADGGLGFDYKWNMGWMHDTLSFMANDPIHRGHHLNSMTFGLVYAFSENFILPLSHDEVAHGKGSILGKMPGDTWQQFANLRAYYGFMWTHPGKKLLFMGGEFGQGREWSHDRELDWDLLEIDWHRGMQSYVRDLNALYRGEPALHVKDCDPEGFEWLEADDRQHVVLAYLRRGGPNDPPVLVVNNWTPVPRPDYRIGCPDGGRWRLLLNSDETRYAGSGAPVRAELPVDPTGYHERPASVTIDLPPLATLIYRWEPA